MSNYKYNYGGLSLRAAATSHIRILIIIELPALGSPRLLEVLPFLAYSTPKQVV